MILTSCPACAAPLAHDAPRCVRCHTRYCNKICQHDHLQENYAEILFAPQNASRKDQREAVAVIADATKARRRIFGSKHPYTMNALETQESANMRLEDFDAPPS